MSVSYDTLALYDELTSSELAKLKHTIRKNPQLASALEDWIGLRTAVREDLKQQIISHEMLLLYALGRSGDSSSLTEGESEALDRVRERLDAAYASSETVRLLVSRVSEEQSDFRAAWQRSVDAEIHSTRRISPSWTPLRARRLQWQAIAAVALATLVGVLYVAGRVSDTTVRVATGSDEIKTVTLGDGSTVRLMPDTELTYNQTDGNSDFNRRVTIVGQGLFTVAPSEDVFFVNTPTALTTVLGTTFGIDADQSFTEVVLAEGRLSVSSSRDAQRVVVLEKGEMSRVLRSDPPSRPVRVDITDALQWTRLFVFRSEPVGRVAERLTEHFGVTVSADPALGTEAITGTFEHDWTLRYILEAMASSLGVELHETEEGGFELIAE